MMSWTSLRKNKRIEIIDISKTKGIGKQKTYVLIIIGMLKTNGKTSVLKTNKRTTGT